MEELTTKIHFRYISQFLEGIASDSQFEKKKRRAERFFGELNKYKQTFVEENGSNCNSSLFPVIRLLLSDEEHERTYYLKETSFTKIFIKALGVDNKSQDGIRLLHANEEDLPEEIERVMLLRQRPSKITAKEVDDILNILSDKRQKNIVMESQLSKLILKSNALDLKWLTKIILKRMNLKFGSDKMLTYFHSSAASLFAIYPHFSRVIHLIQAEKNLNDPVKTVEPFYPLRAMLCLKSGKKEIRALLEKDEVYVETKRDGERFQLHMKDHEYRYFSRKGHDYTDTYGANKLQGSLTPYIHNQFKDVIHNIILDGEMLVWNKNEMKFHSKGENFDVKVMRTNDTNLRPCYCVFDILYHNGKNLMNVPYASRIQLLERLFEDREGYLIRNRAVKIRDDQHFVDIVNKAMDDKEEGVILKKISSVYKPGDRSGGWFKIKPDYLEGLVQDFDLLIIGAYYNNANTKDFLYKFMIGVLDKQADGSFKIYCVGEVVHGLTKSMMSDNQQAQINEHLQPHCNLMKNEEVTPFSRGEIIWGRQKPNVWINPEKSCNLEVRASELGKSGDYALEYTLRFPRITAIRFDKIWYEGCTKVEYLSWCKTNMASGGSDGVKKLTTRRFNLDDISPDSPGIKKRKEQGQKIAAKRFKKGTVSEDEDIVVIKNICQNREFVVCSTKKGYPSVPELEKLIKRYGGKTAKNPSETKTFAIIGGDMTSVLRTNLKSKKYNIVKVEWLLFSLTEEKQRLTLRPKDMIFANSELKDIFSAKYDKFGDSWTKPITDSELDELMANIPEEDLKNLTRDQMISLEKEMYKSSASPQIFFDCKAIFIKSLNQDTEYEISKSIFQFYSGLVIEQSDERIHETVDYIFAHSTNSVHKNYLIDNSCNLNHNQIGAVKLINFKWIQDCVNVNQLIDPVPFQIVLK